MIPKPSSQSDTAASIGGYLASQDLPYWVALIALTFFLSLAQSELSQSISTGAFALTLLERVLNLGFLYLVTHRALALVGLARISLKEHLSRLLILLAYGLLLWFTVTIPVISLFIKLPPIQQIVFLVLLIPALTFSVRYFFYFFPIVLGERKTFPVLSGALQINSASRLTVFKILFSAAGLSSLGIALVLMPAPDGRIPLLVNLADSLQALFWISSSYYAIGHCLASVSDSTWNARGLDPYRQARLETLARNAPSFLAAALEPKRGIFLMLLSLLVWSGNTVRIASNPPAPTITILAAKPLDMGAELKLKIEDAVYLFHGFIPMHFAIAGTNREPVCETLTKASLENSEEALYSVPHDLAQRELSLSFNCSRSAEELKQLEDLYLWYRQYKVVAVKFGTLSGGN